VVRDTAWRQAVRTEIGGIDIADEPPADEAAASAQRMRQLIAAVQELPTQAGRAFRLHKLQGLSQAETAQAMGLSVKAVEKHVAAALKALTQRLST
jgi:RNA polymerase sigma factor (sigma-70 family)